MMTEERHTQVQQQYARLNDAKRSHVSLVSHMKGYKALITFQETWDQTCLVFMLLALKKVTTKTYFLHYGIQVNTFYTTLYVLLHWNYSMYKPNFC